MKKVFAIIALLAVSLMFLTACSSITYSENSLKYQFDGNFIEYEFSLNVSSGNAEYFNFDLNLYGANDELLHTEHYEKRWLGEKYQDGCYKYESSFLLADELYGRADEIKSVTIANITLWYFNGPRNAFIIVAVICALMLIVFIPIAASGKRKRTEAQSDASENSEE